MRSALSEPPSDLGVAIAAIASAIDDALGRPGAITRLPVSAEAIVGLGKLWPPTAM